MSVQARVLETTQIGVEETPGTAVPATVKLASVTVEPQTDIDVEMYGPQGIKTDTISILNRERSSASLSGKPTYNELVYLNSACLANPTIQAVQYWNIEVTGASGGTFTFTFDGETTNAIAYDATASTVQTELEALANINAGDIHVSGGPLNTAAVRVKLIGPGFLAQTVATPTVDGANLTGGGAEEVTVTEDESAVAFAWEWIPVVDDADSVHTLTVESVGVTESFRFAYGLVNELGITVSRAPGGNSIDLSGSMVGKPIDFGIADPTAGLTSIDLIPMTPLQFSCYLDETSADDFGTTQFTGAFSAAWTYGPKFMLYESLDASEPAFTGHYEGKVPSTLELQLERNPTATAMLDTLRAGGTVYFRLIGEGPEVETGVPHLFLLDFAAKLTNPNMSVQDELSTITFTLSNVLDATWGNSLRVLMVNDVPYLVAP